MLFSKIYFRRSTFKIVFLTSVFWLALFLFILKYTHDPNVDCDQNPNSLICLHRQFIAKSDTNQASLVGRKRDSIKFGADKNKQSSYDSHLLHHYQRIDLTEYNERFKDEPGSMGRAVVIPGELKEKANKTFVTNQFNLVASDLIGFERSLQDVRSSSCKTKGYANRLPKTSIIIVFHNEAFSTLVRNLHSIVTRTPSALIEEIILIDDHSTSQHIVDGSIEGYLETFKDQATIKYHRMEERSGLIRARLKGASMSKGTILTFLDAHCECTEGWLEPLLDEISRDKTSVVCPTIDVISDTDFGYVKAINNVWGGFNWYMNFRWFPVPQRERERRGGDDSSEPILSPTMAGGLFSIDKEYFYALGSYDNGMVVWGGENLEMSFRIWQCGGSLKIVTCSHVGHVFREKTSYTFPGGVSYVVNRNQGRTVHVWMDHYEDFIAKINPGLKKAEIGDISGRLSLRKELKCKSFDWYLRNIYPETTFPLDYYYLGAIRNEGVDECIDTLGHKTGKSVGASFCHGRGGNQLFLYNDKQEILTDDKCLEAASVEKKSKKGDAYFEVLLKKCHGLSGNQAWSYSKRDKRIRHISSGRCLSLSISPYDQPVLMKCESFESDSVLPSKQSWLMKSPFEWKNPTNKLKTFS